MGTSRVPYGPSNVRNRVGTALCHCGRMPHMWCAKCRPPDAHGPTPRADPAPCIAPRTVKMMIRSPCVTGTASSTSGMASTSRSDSLVWSRPNPDAPAAWQACTNGPHAICAAGVRGARNVPVKNESRARGPFAHVPHAHAPSRSLSPTHMNPMHRAPHQNSWAHLVCPVGDLGVRLSYNFEPCRELGQLKHEVVERAALDLRVHVWPQLRDNASP
jgi:hypothetical protein